MLSGYVFCDDYEDGNASGWTTTGGSWSVLTDSGYVYAGGSGSYSSTAGLSTWTDQTVQARVKILAFGGTSSSYRAGIVARFAQSTNYYALSVDATGAVRLLRGTSSPSGATGACAATPSGLPRSRTLDHLKITVSGPSASVHVPDLKRLRT
jgi:pectate lyase